MNTQIITPFLAAMSALVAAGAFFLGRLSFQIQILLDIQNTARTIHFSRGMDAIRSLPSKSFDEYLKLDKEKKDDIRAVVDFLNDLWHVTKHHYIIRKHVKCMYYISIEACVIKLHPDWVDGFREIYTLDGTRGKKSYYQGFYSWCEEVRQDIKHQ